MDATEFTCLCLFCTRKTAPFDGGGTYWHVDCLYSPLRGLNSFSRRIEKEPSLFRFLFLFLGFRHT